MDIYKAVKEELQLEEVNWIDNVSLKSKLQSAYDKVRIAKKATASDIQLFYQSTPNQQRVDGIQINGYKIFKD